MTDEEFLFNQTAKERKRIARGDYNKKRQGGKTIRFPSDHLTKKEREAMNGEVKTYGMEKPVDWQTFKHWPEDLQRAYLLGLRERFNAFTTPVAEMLGVSTLTVSNLQKKLGISLQSGGRRPNLKKKEWELFLCGIAEVPEPPAEVLVCAGEESGADETPAPEKLDTLDLNALRIEHICVLLQALKGSGAELTIKVTL